MITLHHPINVVGELVHDLTEFVRAVEELES
ncbi:hypothetical protein XBFM1_2200012 [Xenorhabdus bovienii str. feltiae Moldova]|uniref:Uncharacterized protein n=1 Tax=Xenorhabdus bovienii str. feltiae Moldova TaxID=1398200 RepID=A0A077NHD6_XENBV|nr:hypothetical protein XBFM1_2200012 [Xenorhabdus bovienii str. feltiae Moldova]